MSSIAASHPLRATVTAEEIAGRIESVQTAIHVENLTPTTDLAAKIQQALGTSGLPVNGDVLTINSQEVVLERRNVQMSSESAEDAMVSLVYRRQEAGDSITWRGGTALQQITTELDINGLPITVTHNGVSQGGEINVLEAQSTLIGDPVVETNSPGVISQSWAGRVASNAWEGGQPGEWLCESVTFEPVDLTSDPNRYRLTFTMRRKAGGWQPSAVYVDPETDRPPPDLVEGQSIKTVEWYPSKDFDEIEDL